MKVGTSLYIAPEVLSSTKYDNKCDVYSFGIIMFQVLTQSEVIYTPEQIGNYNVDYKVGNDPNFKPIIPDNYLNDKKYESYIGYF
jgi:serine/threonine protein kinase